jgi:hypothetical protein
MIPLTWHTAKIGDAVWAPVGGGDTLGSAYGWRAGVVVGRGPKYCRVQFLDKGGAPKGFGKRLYKLLVIRRPALNGKDKPAPDYHLDASEVSK